jgi:hypothetical protein
MLVDTEHSVRSTAHRCRERFSKSTTYAVEVRYCEWLVLQVVDWHLFRSWLTSLDNFRNWLALGLQPAKVHENRPRVRMASAGAARSNRASGAVEAEQLFDPERA